MIKKLLSIGLFFLAFLLPLSASAQCGDSYGKNGLCISYAYGGVEDIGPTIASSATACYHGKMMATAKAIKIIVTNPGPYQLEVKETHYNSNGTIAYEGIIIFRFGGIDGAYQEEEWAIKGQKHKSFFGHWPSGNR